MDALPVPYYRPDLALVHHLGFGFHADLCAPSILKLLEPVRPRHGVIVELGCGSGLLTRHLIEAGHAVVATDASPAMLDLASRHAPGAEGMRRLVLPDDTIPAADAIVSVGHALNYLADEDAVYRALGARRSWAAAAGTAGTDLRLGHPCSPGTHLTVRLVEKDGLRPVAGSGGVRQGAGVYPIVLQGA